MPINKNIALLHKSEVRTAFKGQLFSAPMDWAGMVKQLENMEHNEAYRCVPVSGEALAARVQLQIQAGLVDLNRLIKQATVRRHVVVQLIRMWRDAGHPDYKDAFQGQAFYRRLHALSPIKEASVDVSVMFNMYTMYVSLTFREHIHI